MSTPLTIAAATLVLCIFSLFLIYNLAGGLMYRNPNWLFGIGCVVAVLAVVVKALPILSKEVWPSAGKEGFDIAAATVDPTLMALAGGLIGAAFLLKAQWLCESELQSLWKSLRLIEHNLEREMRRGPLSEEHRALWTAVCAQYRKDQKLIHKRIRRLSGGNVDLKEWMPALENESHCCRCNPNNRSTWSD